MIIVLDYGSQYTQLIARRIRELQVYSVILPYNAPIKPQDYPQLRGIILSGGPASVYGDQGLAMNADCLELEVPILGICYGAQLLASTFAGQVEQAHEREFGRAVCTIVDDTDLFQDITQKQLTVWMSHGDKITKLPEGFTAIGTSENSPYAAIRHAERRLFGVQFHPEVHHTTAGTKILTNFVHRICGCAPNWTSASFIENTITDIQRQVGSEKVLCAVSGGVDSTVMAVLLNRAVGKQATAIFVDNGLLRQGEAEEVRHWLGEELGVNLEFVDARERFWQALAGVVNPEEKRKIIGHTFIDVFAASAERLGGATFLAQGTLYPDLIESVSHVGPSATIKSHHNVGGLPEQLPFKLIEPLKELFKDEVRAVGKGLGISSRWLQRHPFPGPGLAVRVLGEVTPQRLELLQQADAIFIDELHKADLYHKVWQALAVLLPVKSVGVMGDSRTYENVVALRAVTSTDGMTADWAELPGEFLASVSTRIINEVAGVNRVVYDISSKPPSTIEWE